MKLFPRTELVLDIMVYIDARPLNFQCCNSADLVFNIMVSGWAISRTSHRGVTFYGQIRPLNPNASHLGQIHGIEYWTSE